MLRLQIRFGKWHSLSTQLNWSPGVLTGLSPSHTTHKTTKNAVIFHTHYNFFCITATILSTVFYMGNDFPTDFFRETFAVLCVGCEGLLQSLVSQTLYEAKLKIMFCTWISKSCWELQPDYFEEYSLQAGIYHVTLPLSEIPTVWVLSDLSHRQANHPHVMS